MTKAISKLARSRVVVISTLILVLALFWVRLIHLDQDLPPWGVGLYQPKDEGCYAVLAINEMEYGQMNPINPLSDGDGRPMYIQEHVRMNLLGNLLERVSFRLFGDNYAGLRSPMLWIGFANLLLMLAILFRLRSLYGKGTTEELWGIVGVMLLVSLHFQFYVSSRTVEPSTMRMLFLQLAVLIWLMLNRHRCICFFLMGACICTSVFLVYLTNLFLILATGLLLLFIWKHEGFKRFFSGAVCAVIGGLVLFAVAELYYRRVWGCSSITNMLGTFGLFNSLEGYTVSTSAFGFVWGAVKSVFKYFSSLWFLYAPSLLFLSLLAWPVAFRRAWKDKDGTLLFIAVIPVAFLMQTMVSEDYIWRKLIVAAPCFVFLAYWFVLKRREIIQAWNERSNCQSAQKWKRLPWLWMAASAMGVCAMSLFHLKVSHDLGKLDFSKVDKMALLLAALCVMAWTFLFLRRRRRGRQVGLTLSVVLLGVSVLAPNLVLLTEYVWAAPKYTERDMMISLSEDYGLDGKYVIGDYVMGITLYNDLKPVYDSYFNYGARLTENKDLVLHHYKTDSPDFKQYMDTVLFSPYSNYTAKQMDVIPSGFQTYGTVRDFALYKAQTKVQAYREERDAILDIQAQVQELENANVGMDTQMLLNKRQELEKKLAESYLTISDIYNDYQGDILSTVYSDIYGNIYGDICAPVFGRIYGAVYGDILSNVEGDIYGDVYGSITVPIHGVVQGTVYGKVPDSVTVLHRKLSVEEADKKRAEETVGKTENMAEQAEEYGKEPNDK